MPKNSGKAKTREERLKSHMKLFNSKKLPPRGSGQASGDILGRSR